MDRLQAMINNGPASKYPKLVFDVLMESREEVKDENQRNTVLAVGLRLRREENFLSKQNSVHWKPRNQLHRECCKF